MDTSYLAGFFDAYRCLADQLDPFIGLNFYAKTWSLSVFDEEWENFQKEAPDNTFQSLSVENARVGILQFFCLPLNLSDKALKRTLENQSCLKSQGEKLALQMGLEFWDHLADEMQLDANAKIYFSWAQNRKAFRSMNDLPHGPDDFPGEYIFRGAKQGCALYFGWGD